MGGGGGGGGGLSSVPRAISVPNINSILDHRVGLELQRHVKENC